MIIKMIIIMINGRGDNRSGDLSNYSIIEIGQNTKKTP